jgi:hypothetical protein
MEIREVLEGLAARLAAQKSKPEDWLDLKEEFGENFERISEEKTFPSFRLKIFEFFEPKLSFVDKYQKMNFPTIFGFDEKTKKNG